MNNSSKHRPCSEFLRRILVLTILLPFLYESLNAQSYPPFHANAVAVYTTAPVAGPTSSLAFTAVELLEGDSIFYPVKTFDPENWNDMLEPGWDNCEESFWSTGGMCHPADVPLWLGAEMRKTELDTYEYTNAGGEVLTFNFGIAVGDSALIFQNAEMQLYLIAEGESTGNFLGIEDSIFQYRLAHLNPEGEPLGTALHDAPITLGAQLGAIHFMRIDSFPQILQPITIAGHSGAQAGLYTVMEADVYDFQVGDVFQHFYQSNWTNPFDTESYYETRTVIERVEDESQILYTFDVHRFTLDSTINDNFDEEQIVLKTAVIASFPFEIQAIEGSQSDNVPDGYLFNNLTLTDDSCGSNFIFSSTGSYFHNCPVEGIACFGNTFHSAPSEWHTNPSEVIYKQGFGMTYSYEGWSITGEGVSGSETRELIYSSKNGFECGNQIVLNVENHVAGKQVLRVYPNPASTTVRFDLPGVLLTQVTLHDMQGRRVMDVAVQQSEPTIDVSSLPKGMYLVRAVGRSGEEFMTKLVVE